MHRKTAVDSKRACVALAAAVTFWLVMFFTPVVSSRHAGLSLTPLMFLLGAIGITFGVSSISNREPQWPFALFAAVLSIIPFAMQWWSLHRVGQ